MDDIDLANEISERDLAKRIDAARASKPTAIVPSAVCVNCGEPTEGGRRFDTAECAQDFESRAKRKRFAGLT